MSTAWVRRSFVLTVAALLLLAQSGFAKRFVPPQAGAKTAGAGAGGSPFATQIAELRATRALLEQADHDYKGHRAAAVKLITTAIHTLKPHPTNAAHAKGAAGKATGGGAKSAAAKQAAKTGGNEPQAVSDAQLKQAIGQLTTIQSQLAGAQGAAAATASAGLQKAVQELQTALSIK